MTNIYTLTYDSIQGDFFFGISSADHPFYRHRYSDFPPELLANYEVGGMLPTYEDEHGVWLSAFSPVKDKENIGR